MRRSKERNRGSIVSTLFRCEPVVVGVLIGACVLRLGPGAEGTGTAPRADREGLSDSHRARLVSQLEHSDWLVREMSAEALGEFDDPRVIDALIQVLDDGHSRPRQAAARSLGLLKAGKAVPKLIERLGVASEKEEIQAIVIALGEIGDRRAVEPIAGSIKDHGRSMSLYLVCRSVLGFRDPRIADALLEVMRFENGRLDYNIVYRLARLKEKRLFEPLVDALRLEDHKSWRAAFALGQLGDLRAIEPLAGALHSANSSIRESAAEALGMLGDERAVPALIGILARTGEDREVREAAIRALGRLGDQDVIIAIGPFTTHPDDALRTAAGEAVADIELGAFRARHREGAEKAAEIAASALKEGSVTQRWAAVRALGEIGGPDAAATLADPLKEPDASVRAEIINALRVIDDARAAAGLERALSDPEDGNRWRAVEALAAERSPNALPTLIEYTRSNDEHRREYATRLLRNYDTPQAIAASCALLEDPEEDVREEAAGALSAIADETALEPLLKALQGGSSRWVRASAARALGRIDDLRSVAALEKALSDDDDAVTLMAARSLARLGWEPPEETLRIRYMIASGRADEADASLPEAQQVGEGFRLEGEFALDTPILTPLTVGTREHPKVVILHRIEFYELDRRLRAKLFVNHITWPDSAWLFTIELLDESGQGVASATHKYRVAGMSLGIPLITDMRPVEFDFGEVENPGKIRKFTITVEQTVIGHASYQWFRNPSNGHFYCLTDPLPWKAAREKATQLGGHLATVNDAGENDWLRTTFNDCGTVFISLTDLEKEGIWIWTSEENSSYRNWDGGEPNDANGNEDVVVIHGDGEWNDISIDTEGRGIVEAEKAPKGSAGE